MMNRRSLWLAGVLLLFAVLAKAQSEAPEEIIVTGRLPGPALWKVSAGDNNLWIFALMSPLPKDLQWESKRVEQVLAEADEFIEPPGVSIGVSASVKYNPINWVRGIGFYKRFRKNPGNKKLQEILPLPLYQRFAALKAQYFPANKEVEDLRPLFAAEQMTMLVLQQNGLVVKGDIMDKIATLASHNRHIKTTTTELTMTLEGSYGEVTKRAEIMLDSMSEGNEVACMEKQVSSLEHDIEMMKRRANNWAQGHVDALRDSAFALGDADPCTLLLSESSEKTTAAELAARIQQQWLAAAEKALATNHSTFAVLDIGALTSAKGLLAQLREKGYEVKEPGR